MKLKALNKAISLVLLTGGLAVASGAQAALVTDSYTNIHEVTEINQSGSLVKFDAALGTLNSATLTFSAESISSSFLTNNAAGANTFEFDSILNFFFDASSVGVTVPVPVFVTTLATTGGFVTLGGSGGTLDLGTNTDDASYSVTLLGADLAGFIGAGTFNTSCTTISGSTFLGGGGNIANVQNTTAFCGAEISYDYTEAVAVSSPASIFLFGTGLLGLAGARRAKKMAKK